MAEIMANSSVLKYGISVGTEEIEIDCEKKDEVQTEQVLVGAAALGDYEKIIELLNSGVSVDAEEHNKLLFYASKNYVTPLQIAAANGQVKCVKILIDHGADVNAKDRFDVTALHMAAEKGNYLCVKALLDAGADCCVRTKFSKMGCYTAVPHLGGTNPLHLAAANNHVDVVKELIQYGADYNAVDERGRTSLYIAAQAGFDECVLAHLRNAVGRDILSLPSFESSDTPLHFAVSHGMVECVRELLYLGSDVNHINHMGCSPLHMALTPSNEKSSSKMEILQLLVLEGYKTDINCPDAAGFTPLHYVCFNGYRNLWCRRPEMAKFLIAYGADVNIKNNQGIALLELELKSSEKNYDVLKYLVKSMLQLPHLKSLNVGPRRESAPNPQPAEVRHPDQLQVQNLIFRGLNQQLNVPDPRIQQGGNQDDIDHFLGPPRHGVMGQLDPVMREYLRDPAFRESLRDPAFRESLRDPVFRESLRDPVFRESVMVDPSLRESIRDRMRIQARQPLLMHVYDAIEGILDERNPPENENEAESNAHFDSPCILKKQLWYEKIASNPRTLQHHCRYTVRNFMGPMKLKYIRKLPIPAALQSYLLLDYDE